MAKQMLAAVVVLSACGTVMALSPMGPPTASLEQGQFSLGGNYFYSEMDLDVDVLGTLDDAEVQFIGTTLSYGISEAWEVFVRLGVTDIEFEDWDSGSEFAYGFGTKVTFLEGDVVDWGVLFEMNWFEGEDDGTFLLDTYTVSDPDIDGYEMQIAVGPTYKGDGMRVYGGPFLHFVDADLDFTVVSPALGGVSLDVEEESVFGGFVGTEFDIAENALFNIEGAFTADAWGVGFAVAWRF